MSGKGQSVWTWFPAVFGANIGRASAIPGAVAGKPLGVVWPDRTSSNGHRKEAQPKKPFRGGRSVQLLYALIDICIVVTTGAVTFTLRYYRGDPFHLFHAKFGIVTDQPFISYEGFLALYIGLILLFFDWQDLYRTPRTRTAKQESMAVVKALSLSTLLLTAFIYLSGARFISRFIIAGSLLLNTVALIAWRYGKRKLVIHRALRGAGLRNVAIIGAGKVGQELARQFEENKLLGYEFKGFLDGNHVGGPRMLGKIEDLSRVARSQFLDEVFITIPSERELVKQIAVEAREQRLDVKVVPELYDGLCWNAPITHIGDFPVMEVHWRPIPTLGLLAKRACDVIFSVVGLAVFSPVLAMVAVGVLLDSPGPVVYTSRRVGKKGRPFNCYKFRTMVANADALKDSLRSKNERVGPFFKITEDPRITKFGKFLRKYSLDELPQLWNVLRGEMTLVGPRPHPMDDYRQYTLDHLRRLEVKPGITGLWQTTARRDPSFETNMLLDLEYIERWSLWLDCRILLKTIPAVFRAEGS